MKKVKKKNKLKNFFYINEKQIIFSIIIIILLFINKINSSNTGNNSKIIKFKLDGEIIISNKNIIENNNQLNSPLIFTNINEKNINFKDNNILPTQKGELNYIDPYQHITLLDISLEELFINSPMIIKKYPNLLFISNRTLSLFALNINNGFFYKIEHYNKKALNKNCFQYINEICPKNKNDVLFLRIDYYLQMKYININNNNQKDKYNDLIWNSHYVKIVPIYPRINTEHNNNCFVNKSNDETEDYYIFEVIENKNINLIYSQDKDIFMIIKDIQSEYNFDNYYFGNNKRRHLFKYNVFKKKEKSIYLSIKFLKKFFLLIIIFALSVFCTKIYKIKMNHYIKFILIKKNESTPLETILINNENNNMQIKEENDNNEKPKSPKSKSINNLSLSCSIENENKSKLKNDKIIQSFSLSNIKFKFKQNSSSSKKRNGSRHSTSKSSRRMSRKKSSNLKHLFKNIEKYTEEERKELNNLFITYKNDITKNANESLIDLNFNLSENEEKYRKIFSLIKSDDSSSSEEINLSKESQGFFEGQIENNFLFYFDNGRLLKMYKDFEFIGKGGFGVVFKATNKIDESQCAIKIMKINLDLKEEKEDLKVTQEIKTMLKFKKKNIVRYKTCWFEFKQKKLKKKRERSMSLEQRNVPTINFKEDFLEKGEKNIKNRLKKHLKTPLERIQSISKELKLAVNQNNTQKKK